MVDNTLDIQPDKREDCTVVHLKGSLVFDNCDQLKKQIEALMKSGVKQVILDFSGLRYLDSAGMGTIVGIKVNMAKHTGSLRLAGLRDEVVFIFKASRILRIFDVCDTLDQALGKAW